MANEPQKQDEIEPGAKALASFVVLLLMLLSGYLIGKAIEGPSDLEELFQLAARSEKQTLTIEHNGHVMVIRIEGQVSVDKIR
jgi:hypothetical protein